MTGPEQDGWTHDDGDPVPPDRVKRVLGHPVAILLLVIVLVYLPVLTSGTFFVRDLMLQYIPARSFLTSSLAQGHMPLWNPLLHGGQPFVANPQNLATYPPWLASCFLPVLTGLNFAIVGHLLLAAVSAFWLGRVLGLGRVGSFVAGFGFAFCGVIISLVNLTHMLLTIAWLPALVASFLRLRETMRARWLAIAALSGGMSILAGGAEMILITFFTLAVFSVGVFDPGERGWLRDAGLLLLTVVMAASIGAVRIWSTIDYLPETGRGESQSYTDMVLFSMHPHRLPELVAPGFMGGLNGLETRDYWGRELEGGVPYFYSIHLGGGMLVLMLIGVASGKAHLPGRLRWLLGLLALGSVALALGKHLPGFSLAEGLPLISRFRYPIKILAMAALPVAVLAGAGLQVAANMSSIGRKRIAIALAGTATLLIGVACSVKFGDIDFWNRWFGSPLTQYDRARLAMSIVVPAISLSCIALVASQAKVRQGVVAAVICGEIVFGGASVNSVAPRDIFDEPAILDAVRETTGDGFFLRVRGPVVTRVHGAENSDRWFARWMMEVFELYCAYSWGVPQVFHSDFDGMAPDRIVELGEMVATGDRALVRRVLDLAGVRSILINDPVDDPGITLRGSFRGPGGDTLYLYENESAERIRLLTEPIFVGSREEASVALRSMAFDPRRNVVVETVRREVEPCVAPASSLHVERDGPDEMRVGVSSNCEGYLVIAETHVPGWKTWVDGVEVESVQANLAFAAVWIEKGTHEMVREYRPRGFRRALLLSGGSFMLVLFLALWAPMRSREGGNGRG